MEMDVISDISETVSQSAPDKIFSNSNLHYQRFKKQDEIDYKNT